MDEKTQKIISHRLPELRSIENLRRATEGTARWETLAHVPVKVEGDTLELPIHAMLMGSKDPTAPTFALFGGVHGLERIGTQLVVSYLRTLSELLRWDQSLQYFLEKTRLVAVPLINPAGMLLETRSNANGVDLMRNAPIEAKAIPKWNLVAGQTFSNRIPWYRGDQAHVEAEVQAMMDFVRREIFPSRSAITLDVHSGFGAIDRFWFPYAKSLEPISHLAEVVRIKDLLDRTYPSHVYCVEPQAKQYRTHGDLWDYLYDEQKAQSPERLFLPFSLELGSWIWIKKNPRQLFSLIGAFNPLKEHRHQRIMRRHRMLFDFLWKLLGSDIAITKIDDAKRVELESRGVALWFK